MHRSKRLARSAICFLSVKLCGHSVLLTLRTTAIRDEFVIKFLYPADLLDVFVQELPRENNTATMIRRRTGTFPTSRCAPAERSGAHHGVMAAPYVGLALLRHSRFLRRPRQSKQGETQMHADKQG
jgi:hypothetical protein